MKIDLHVHSSERSRCGVACEEDQIQSAIDKGLNALVFTDHYNLVPKDRLKELNDKYSPFRIFGGIEVSVRYDGKYEDIIVLGVDDPKIETSIKNMWGYDELYNFVVNHDGYLAIVHPYRYRDDIVDIGNFPPHAVELYSSKLEDGKHEKRIELAKKWDCHLITNSDSHETDTVGVYYNELFDTPKNEKELIKILKEGRYQISKK
ncbi:MAG: PHP domain-containing protein [Nanoarchaeota archaeon]|nr:PHP domain-containing protein [Nanoarchaeota archaeon]